MRSSHYKTGHTNMSATSAARKSALTLRPMTGQDLEQVCEVEKQSFPDPWPKSSFRDCLEYGYSCWVLEQDATIQAFGVMALDLFNAHILNLCVRPEFQNQRRGRKVLSHLLDEARSARVEKVFLEVRASNEAAISLYRSMGFEQVGVRKGYYRRARQREDALVFALALSEPQKA